MINIVILEDEVGAMNEIQSCIARYSEESGLIFNVTAYDNAVDLLENYKAAADIIFMDIQMPIMDGMSAAKKIREIDKEVIIVFITNLAQYAIEGYEVNAFDFILKPVRYTGFSMKLDRIVKEINHNRNDATINLQTREGMRRIIIADILYAEVKNHDIILHTVGDEIKMRTTLSKLSEQLRQHHFVLCNACYLVNLRHVNKIDLDFAVVGDHQLRISQSKRKAFLSDVAKYLGASE